MILYRIGERLLRRPVTTMYRVDGEGWERIPARGPAVLAANHESVLDGFAMGMATRRVIHWMGKAELWDNPFTRPLMNGLGAFPVRRDRGDGAAIDHGEALLERGELVGVFPQGTCLPYRNRLWKRGAARLALATGAPLVPVCLVGTERAIRPHKLKLGLPRVRVLVGEPLVWAARIPTPEEAEELTAELERRVEELRRPYGPPQHVWID